MSAEFCERPPRPDGSLAMRMQTRSAALGSLLALLALPALADDKPKIGTLICDVSKGIGMIIMEKQKLSCVFTNDKTKATETYTGSIDEFGVALGEVKEGRLVWGVLAADSGPPAGFLAGKYAGLGEDASFGVGAGANVLAGGSQNAVSLQPISVEGETGINIAGGITTLTLTAGP